MFHNVLIVNYLFLKSMEDPLERRLFQSEQAILRKTNATVRSSPSQYLCKWFIYIYYCSYSAVKWVVYVTHFQFAATGVVIIYFITSMFRVLFGEEWVSFTYIYRKYCEKGKNIIIFWYTLLLKNLSSLLTQSSSLSLELSVLFSFLSEYCEISYYLYFLISYSR